mmetsp:Transcript_126548/g.354350  ORF Transcript_126548/g.354350 Transcript_126548/m.354350 type:complete len:331 (-) Transcript_126548:314-1306(-)
MGAGARQGLRHLRGEEVVPLPALHLRLGDHGTLPQVLRRPREARHDPGGRHRLVPLCLPLPDHLRRDLRELRDGWPCALRPGARGVVDRRQRRQHDIAHDLGHLAVRGHVQHRADLGDDLVVVVHLLRGLLAHELVDSDLARPLPHPPEDPRPNRQHLQGHQGRSPGLLVALRVACRADQGRRVPGVLQQPLRGPRRGPRGRVETLRLDDAALAEECFGPPHRLGHEGRSEHRWPEGGCEAVRRPRTGVRDVQGSSDFGLRPVHRGAPHGGLRRRLAGAGGAGPAVEDQERGAGAGVLPALARAPGEVGEHLRQDRDRRLRGAVLCLGRV